MPTEPPLPPADALSPEENLSPALGGGHRRLLPVENAPGLGGDAALAHLLEALHDDDPAIRERAAEALDGVTDERAVALLLEALRDDSASVRARAARALGSAGAGDQAVITALLGALHDSAPLVRQSAAEALGQTGDTGAVEALLDALNDPGIGVRQRAAEALGIIAARPPDSLDGEARAERVRIRIVNGLLSAMRATSYLVYLTVLRSIAAALVRIGEPVVPDLLAALRENNARVSTAAAEVLAQLYPGIADPVMKRGVVLALIETVSSPEAFVSLTAIRALASLAVREDALRKRVVDAILKLFDRTDASHQPPVVLPLPRRGGGRVGIPVAPQGGQYVRPDIAEALGRLGVQHPTTAEQVLPALIEAMDDVNSDVRRAGIRALGDVGAVYPHIAAAAVPALARRLADSSSRPFSPDAPIGDLAASALRRIGTPEAQQALARHAPPYPRRRERDE